MTICQEHYQAVQPKIEQYEKGYPHSTNVSVVKSLIPDDAFCPPLSEILNKSSVSTEVQVDHISVGMESLSTEELEPPLSSKRFYTLLQLNFL